MISLEGHDKLSNTQKLSLLIVTLIDNETFKVVR